ncbi:hypothetical protein E4U21_001329 [Claviceps maximensis]|nr:hypothetical protein E4U21_001329 [Claviceps maximensis]
MASRRRIRLKLTRTPDGTVSTPKGFAEVEDEPMPDVGAGDDGSEHEEPSRAQEDDDDQEETRIDEEDNGNAGEEEEGEEGEEEEDGAEDEEADDDDDEETDAAAAAKDQGSAREPSPLLRPVVRRKRLGRPPKNKPPDWDPMVTVPDDTPRRRGRGGWRGRGGRKGGPTIPKAEQVIDADGTIAEIVDDECVLPEDAEGQTKVDKFGNLEGGREYRCRTFTVLGRGDRLYMLSTEPARCVGFRDSYLFFTKHRKLHKIIVDDDEKRDMIEREIIPHSYKGRSIGVVTARSVFREFGARIVVGGKRIVDDFNVKQLREEGVVEGQLADPDDHFIPGQPYNKNQYVAWHGASAVYHTNAPTAPVPNGKPEYKKRKVNVNDTNWMLEHAREASIFNASINAIRRLNNRGVYDVHTNVMQYPAMMQPTRVRIEQVSPHESTTTNTSTTAATWTTSQKFPPVSPRMAKNFLIMDTYCESAPSNEASRPCSKEIPADFVASFHGIEALSNDIKDLLPRECRAALDKALLANAAFQSRWGTERETMSRRDPVIDKAIVPYSMS